MFSFKKIVNLFIFLAVVSLVVSCGPPSILKKSPASKVKTFALVSVSANRGVRNIEGKGKIGGIMALTSLIKSKTEDKDKKKDDDAFDFGGNKLIDFAVEAFEEQFSQVKGWQLTSSQQILNSAAYAKFSKNMKTYFDDQPGSTLMKTATIAVDGMAHVFYGGISNDEKQMLTELAQDLKLDAVVVLTVDMAYAPSTAVGGTGTAAASVGLGVNMVNKFGDHVIEAPNEKKQLFRVRSEETVAMVASNIIYSSAAEAIFKESISMGLAQMKDKINQELSD